MRRTLLFLSLLLAASGPACSCSGGIVNQETGSIELPSALLEFGPVCLGDTATARLAVENRGAVPLNLLGVTASDPAFEVVSFPERLGPNGRADATGEIVVSFHPGLGGDYFTTLVIESDDGEKPLVQADVSGIGDDGERVQLQLLCEAPDLVEPQACGSSLSFDQTSVGAVKEMPVILDNLGCAALTVTDLYVSDRDGSRLDDPTGAWSVTGPEPEFELSHRSPQMVVPAFRPDQVDLYNAHLKVVWEDRGVGAAAETLSIAMVGSGETLNVVVDPPSFTFSEADISTPQTQQFVIRNSGFTAGEIRSITLEKPVSPFGVSLPAGQAPWALGAGDTLAFEVTYQPTVAGRDLDTVLVETDMGTVEVQLVGGLVPRLVVSPADIVDFGVVGTGETAWQTVTLENQGRAALTVSTLQATPENTFSVEGVSLPLVLQAGDQAQVDLRFDDGIHVGAHEEPTRSSPSESGELVIVSDDPMYETLGGEYLLLIDTDTQANFGPEIRILLAGGDSCLGPASQVSCTVAPGQPVSFNAEESSDPEKDPLTFTWQLAKVAPTSTAALTTITGPLTSLTPDLQGAYEVDLFVEDPYGNRQQATVHIQVQEP